MDGKPGITLFAIMGDQPLTSNKHGYWKLPFVVDLTIKNGDFP